MTEVTWENRKGCFFGPLKLQLKILMGSLQPYVLFMFFVKIFYHLIMYSVWCENASSSDKYTRSENTFYKGFFPLFLLLFHELVKKLFDIKYHQKTEQRPAKGKHRLKTYATESKGSCTLS